ncbi:hypothetical protein PsorP6_014285 [Peronosclerospora sorghi]|uniref:Uncharacterized protein n=1 Tax=Peronosclerospora sorghi TaxID=230839 RepID=A0ACC0VHU3_9STRA|nr:hypothetical protein PsorP6_014285 [Peronosclerospora sorghi]
MKHNEGEVVQLLPATSTNVSKVDDTPRYHALLGIACVACSSLCFGLMATFVKYMTYSFSSMEATFWRSLGVLVFSSITIKVTGTSLVVPRKYRFLLCGRCLLGFLCMCFNFYAMSQMVLADASALTLTSPILTFFFGAIFLHEKIDPVSLWCAFGAFGGLICVLRPGFLFGYDGTVHARRTSWLPEGSALLSALGHVGTCLLVRQLKGLHFLVIVQYFAMTCVTLTMLWLALIQRSFFLPSTFFLWRSILGTSLCAFGGQMLLTRGFQLEKAGVAAVMRYLQVLFVFALDSEILGEKINHWSIVGALVILASAVAIAVRKIQLTMQEGK